MSCKYYTFKDGDYHCMKRGEDVSDDMYYKYCRNYDYDDCPYYKNDSSGGCYLTSACVTAKGLPDDCYELQTLRNYRDTWLKNTENGKDVVEEYYRIAPKIVAAIDKLPTSREIYDTLYIEMVKPCVELIEQEEYEKALELYRDTTLRLKEKYC